MIGEQRLYAALSEYNQAFLDSLPAPENCEYQFSEKFQKKINKLITRAKHPSLHKALRSAVAAILIFAMLFGLTMVISPEARASVIQWIKEQTKSFAGYSFSGPTSVNKEDIQQIQPPPFPDGYQLAQVVEQEGGISYIYFDDQGNIAEFSCMTNGSLFVEKENAIQCSIMIKGIDADIYISNNNQACSVIVWTEESSGYLFQIACIAEKDELIHMAEFVISQR